MGFNHFFQTPMPFRAWVVTTDPGLGGWLSAHQIPFETAVPTSLNEGLDLTPKDLKRFDRQGLLMMRLLRFVGVQDWSLEDRERVPVQVAVGPAQTDPEALLRWGRRVEPSEPLPMVQPAQAISLLPNSSLSLVSIAFELRGEGGVWAGFAEAGCHAFLAAVNIVLAGNYDRALVIGVSSPDNHFVKQVWERGFCSIQQPPVEAAVAIMLGSSSPEGGLHSLKQNLQDPSLDDQKRVSFLEMATDAGETYCEPLPEGLATTPLLGLAALAASGKRGRVGIAETDGHQWEICSEPPP